MTSIDVLFNAIFTAYFSSSRCLIFITDEPDSLNFQPKIPVVIININNHYQSVENMFNYAGCQELIVTVQRPVSVLQHLERQIQLHPDRFNFRKYVFMPRKNPIENPVDIFELPELHYVSDVLLIAEEPNQNSTKSESKFALFNNSTTAYTFWTHRYVSKTGNNMVDMLDKWFSNNRSFLFNRNLFPNKLKNQEGRALKPAVFTYEPYIIVEPLDNNSYFYMGFEMITILSFAKHHNMTLTPVIIQSDYWGEIWKNWSGNGIMGYLVEDKADIGAGSLEAWHFAYNFLDVTAPTVRTGITCLVPAPKLASTLWTPFRVYTIPIWIAIMVSFLAILAVLYAQGVFHISINPSSSRTRNDSYIKVKLFRKALTSLFKPFVEQNIADKEIIDGPVKRYVMGLEFMATSILSAAYFSGLATILTIPRYENPINTIDDFVASGLHWGATQDAWIFSIKEAKEPNLVTSLSRFVTPTEDELRNLSLRGNFAFAMERLPDGNYAIGSYIQEDVIDNYHLMAEDFYWAMSVMMMRKNSILLPYVDIFILKAFEGGLILFWQNEAATQYMDQYVQKAVKYSIHTQQEHVVVTLKLAHLKGVFAIFILGNAISFAVFLAELMHYRLKSLSTKY